MEAGKLSLLEGMPTRRTTPRLDLEKLPFEIYLETVRRL